MPRLGSSSRWYRALLCAVLPLILAVDARAGDPVVCPSSTTALTHPASSPVGESRIGANAPFNITSDTATKIVVHVPAGATTGKIKVKTSGGTAQSSTKFTVT